MEFPKKILDEINKSKLLMEKYFEETKSFTLSKKNCEKYLDIVFGCLKEYQLCYDGKIRIIQKDFSNWGQFIVRIYFPLEGICFVCSIEKALTLSPVRITLNNDMKEKATKIHYYDEDLKKVLPGPYIIISTITSDIIFFDNGETLKEKISNDTSLFGMFT